MRTIEISTEVFAKIWSQRVVGEESENAILTRLLGLQKQPRQPIFELSMTVIRWRDDVRAGLRALGGSAHLKEIYDQVRTVRRAASRSVPKNLEAIVRRELEYNSSDAESFQGKHDWFRSVDGIGAGIWALREGEAG